MQNIMHCFLGGMLSYARKKSTAFTKKRPFWAEN
jgi:hypothetical protein